MGGTSCEAHTRVAAHTHTGRTAKHHHDIIMMVGTSAEQAISASTPLLRSAVMNGGGEDACQQYHTRLPLK